MNTRVKSNLFLFLAAIIWGFAFVAQVEVAGHIGDMSFNGVRCLLGAFSLIPVILIFEREKLSLAQWTPYIKYGLLCGTVLFAATAAVLFITLSKHTKEWTDKGPFADPSTDLIFQHIGKPKRAIIISLTRQMIFLVPLLMILPSKYGVLGVWLSMPIADSMSAILAAIFLVLQVRNFRREMAERR